MRFRPYVFVPWWVVVWGSGPRYSLRRLIGVSIAIGFAAFTVASVWFWSIANDPRPFARALPYAELGAIAAAAYATIEPFGHILIDTLSLRRLTTTALEQTGWGFVGWIAFLIASALLRESAHVPVLHDWLSRLRAEQRASADVKFLAASTLGVLPFVIALRQLAIYSGSRYASVRVAVEPKPRIAPTFTPIDGVSPFVVPRRAARIVSIESTPSDTAGESAEDK